MAASSRKQIAEHLKQYPVATGREGCEAVRGSPVRTPRAEQSRPRRGAEGGGPGSRRRLRRAAAGEILPAAGKPNRGLPLPSCCASS